MRALARQVGQRAGTVGLAAEDVLDVDTLGRDRDDMMEVEETVRSQRAAGLNLSFGMPIEQLGSTARRPGETQEGWKIRVSVFFV